MDKDYLSNSDHKVVAFPPIKILVEIFGLKWKLCLIRQ